MFIEKKNYIVLKNHFLRLIKEIKKLTELHIVKTVYNVLRLSRSISKP